MDFREERTCAQRTERIRELNDQLRTRGIGGKLFVTQAVTQLRPPVMTALILAVRQFDDFTPANDPYGEHDFGSVSVAGETFFWKVEVYDVNLEFGSPDPADDTVSRRTLTIMAATDW